MDRYEGSPKGVFKLSVVALVSGGIDSLVMCKIIEKQGYQVLPIFIDYGQLAAKKEWETCQKLFQECEFPDVKKIDVNGYGKFISSGLTDSEKNLTDDAFLPGRNMLFLLIASAYAHNTKNDTISIGLLSEESHLFPDQTEEFIVNANFALNSAMGDDFKIITPLINFSKNDVVKLAIRYKLPIEKTYSCHLGNDKYCGKCVACKEIIDSGLKDFFPQFKGDD